MNVTKTIAVKLKEAGYDKPCRGCYEGKDDTLTIYHRESNHNRYNRGYSAPTVYDVLLWLDEKGIFVNVEITHLRYKLAAYAHVHLQGQLVSIFEDRIPRDSRILADIAGIEIALDHILNKKV